jgi:hypothetical protein
MRQSKTERNDKILHAYLADTSMSEVGASFGIGKGTQGVLGDA